MHEPAADRVGAGGELDVLVGAVLAGGQEVKAQPGRLQQPRAELDVAIGLDLADRHIGGHRVGLDQPVELLPVLKEIHGAAEPVHDRDVGERELTRAQLLEPGRLPPLPLFQGLRTGVGDESGPGADQVAELTIRGAADPGKALADGGGQAVQALGELVKVAESSAGQPASARTGRRGRLA